MKGEKAVSRDRFFPLHRSSPQGTSHRNPRRAHGVAFSASLLFNAQVPVEPMARVCAAGYDDLSPDSDDDSPRLTKDPRSAACGAEVSPLKPVMPRVLTTVSSMVKHPETSTWHVRMGDDVPKLLYANGPARIVLHNYNVVRESTRATCSSAGDSSSSSSPESALSSSEGGMSVGESHVCERRARARELRAASCDLTSSKSRIHSCSKSRSCEYF